MNNLRLFEATNEYNEFKCSFEDNTVSYIKENELVMLGGGKSYLTATYNVTSTTSVTNILSYNFTISQVSKMYIDDVEIEPTRTYTFNTNGEHTVKCEFCELTNCNSMFYNCTSLTSLDLSNLDTSKVTNMCSMFRGCSSLTSLDLTPLDTSNITDMSQMFYSCISLTSLDLTQLKTSNVTDISYMFYYCISLTSLKIMGDISKVTSYSRMFDEITTSGTLTYNCAYEDAWNNILVTNQSTSYFPTTWTKTCEQYS